MNKEEWVNKKKGLSAWPSWLGLGAVALVLGCGEVGGGGQCSGVDASGMCVTIDSIQPTNGEDNTSDVDAFQTADCDGDPATSDPEPFGKHSAEVTISAILMPGVTSPPAPAFVTLTGYAIEYLPNSTNLVTAPALSSQGPFIPTGKTINVGQDPVPQTMELVQVQTKSQYVTGGGGFVPASYTAQYTITGTTQFNQEVTLIGSTTFNIGSFNNCGG